MSEAASRQLWPKFAGESTSSKNPSGKKTPGKKHNRTSLPKVQGSILSTPLGRPGKTYPRPKSRGLTLLRANKKQSVLITHTQMKENERSATPEEKASYSQRIGKLNLLSGPKQEPY